MPDPHPQPNDSDTADLRRVLGEIQRRGAIGRLDLGDAIAHADRYAAAIPSSARTAIDLGSGGGLPGLVIAVRCSQLSLTLVERRAKRVDLLRYGVRALEVGDRVDVVDLDVERWVASSSRPAVDVVTARSFAPLPEVLRVAAALLLPGGICLVSAPPDTLAPPDVVGWRAEVASPGLWVFHVEPAG